MIYPNDYINKVICGNCLEVMKGIPDNSVDLVLTDPPYGISFMGKDWDKFNEIVNPQGAYAKKKGFKKLPRQKPNAMIEFFVPVWQECLRILKEGAFAFVMCSPRQDVLSKQIVALSQAGFQTGFTSIYWTYASGFPKAQNIGKMVDKRGGTNPNDLRKFKKWFRKQIENSNKTQEQINKECRFTATSYYKTDGKDYWTSAFPTEVKWIIIKRVMNLPDKWDWLIKRYDKERGYIEPTGNLHQSDDTKSIKFSGKQLSNNPYSPQAKALDGSYAGFQPKPAVEVILVAMKPLSEKTYVDQAMKNKKGITWLDDCRIPYESKNEVDTSRICKNTANRGIVGNYGINKKEQEIKLFHQQGRFPANLLVSDDVLNDGRITKSEGGKTTRDKKDSLYDLSYNFKMQGYGDSGSFSRYFDLDKWFCKTFPFFIVPKSSKSEKNKGLDRFSCIVYNIPKGDMLCEENIEQAVLLLKVISDLGAMNLNIVESGESVMAIFPKDILFTTKTIINKITELKTWKSLMHLPTKDFIRDVFGKKMDGGNLVKFAKNSKELMTKIGILQEKVGLVTVNAKNVIYEVLLNIKEKKDWKEYKNSHPTTKPIRLGSYLIMLGSREGDIVVDPFCGSGSFLCSAKITNRKYIGVDNVKDYVEIADKRVKAILDSLFK